MKQSINSDGQRWTGKSFTTEKRCYGTSSRESTRGDRCAGGIGSAIARVFVHEGAKVTITDSVEKQGEAAAKEIGCGLLRLDVTNEQQWVDVIKTVDQKHQDIHVLVNAAGTEGRIAIYICVWRLV